MEHTRSVVCSEDHWVHQKSGPGRGVPVPKIKAMMSSFVLVLYLLLYMKCENLKVQFNKQNRPRVLFSFLWNYIGLMTWIILGSRCGQSVVVIDTKGLVGKKMYTFCYLGQSPLVGLNKFPSIFFSITFILCQTYGLIF